MDNIEFIGLAHKYTEESHHTVDGETQEIVIDEENNTASFTTLFELDFPSSIDSAETELGVRRKEEVTFVFNDSFPLKAPKIYLRDDFPKVFPHINPTETKVNPCIYEGSNDELLQQPKFFDEILDQIALWLSSATTNDLIDYEQGWEPMRTDYSDGLIYLHTTALQDLLSSNSDLPFHSVRYIKTEDDKVYAKLTLEEKKLDKTNNSFSLFFISKDNSCEYLPNDIFTYKDLIDFFKKVNISSLSFFVNGMKKYIKNISLLFVTAFIKRPVNLIGTESDIEILNFAIEARYNKKIDDIVPDAKVYSLSGIEKSSSNLLQKFSGLEKLEDEPHLIQLGCGSLGSKIITHIARSGLTNKITLIDNDSFSDHNFARHTLTNIYAKNVFFPKKAHLLSDALKEFGLANITSYNDDIIKSKEIIKEDAILIDSTADFTVKNFLINKDIKSEVIYTVLHNLSKVGLVLIESKNRGVRLDDILAYFYLLCYQNEYFSDIINADQSQYQTIGQGCGSLTTVVPDSKISILSAAMASIIQNKFSKESGLEEDGDLYIGHIIDDINLTWNKYKVLPPLSLYDKTFDMEVRISKDVVDKIKFESSLYKPNETGGVLIGHISLITKVINIVDLIDAPEDSIRKPNYFELGTSRLKDKVVEYENKTNGLLRYIGTWHSHPRGGTASRKDLKTKVELIQDRKDFPTVCLINSNNNIIVVE